MTRGEVFRDLLPFPVSMESSPAEVALSVAAGRSATVEERLIQEAGKAAWLFLLKWALNFAYGSRRPKQPGRSKAAAAQEEAECQLLRYVEDFVNGPPVTEADWGAELRTVRMNYQQEEV